MNRALSLYHIRIYSDIFIGYFQIFVYHYSLEAKVLVLLWPKRHGLITHMFCYARTHVYEGCITFRQTPRARKKSHNFCGELSTFGQSGIQIVTLQNHCLKQSYVSVHSKVEKIGL